MVAPSALPTEFNFTDFLIAENDRRAERIAYIDDTTTLNYQSLWRQVKQFAGALRASGLTGEERILLVMHDQVDWPVAFLGALYAGVVPVALNTLLTVEDYRYVLTHSQAKAVIVSAPLLATINQAMAQARHDVQQLVVSGAATLPSASAQTPTLTFADYLADATPLAQAKITCADEPAFWLYSSGSTGRPKGTVHTHANLYWTGRLYGQGVLALTEHDRCFSAAKLFFAYGLGNALTFPLMVGASVVLMAERPTPSALFARLTRQRPTLFFCAPTGYAAMLAAEDLPAREEVALRLASSAGEALPAELGQQFSRHFAIPILDGIGSTEMLHIYISNRPEQLRYGSSGWPVPGYEVTLKEEQGQPSAPGDIGDLYIKGPSAALLYWNDRAKSNETFQGAWVKSGDKYSRNDDGSYTYAGRSDDMIKVSGMYVSPFEVEATLIAHPGVLEAAVIGVEDATGLTKTRAYIVLKANQQVDADTLKAFVKDRLAPYKYPREIVFVPELPKTATGKIQRFKLRQASRA